MKGNPQNIEVGDVVSFTSIGDQITSVVLSICDQGYIQNVDENSIDGYLVRATVMNKGTVCNYPVKNLTIVRKWNVSVPVEQMKKSKVKSQITYSLLRITDKSFETLILAVKLIEGLTLSDIVEVDRVNQIIEVTRNLIDKITEFVNTKNRTFDPFCEQYITFDGINFWNKNEIIAVQCFLDDVVEPIIVEELKRRTLANEQ